MSWSTTSKRAAPCSPRRPGPLHRRRARAGRRPFSTTTPSSAPAPLSGGIVLLSALNILEGYNLARLGDRTPQSMHLIVEAFRRAYMDRADYLGDPDYNPSPSPS